jgi:hypothetical protein
MNLDNSYNKLTTLGEYIDDTEVRTWVGQLLRIWGLAGAIGVLPIVVMIKLNWATCCSLVPPFFALLLSSALQDYFFLAGFCQAGHRHVTEPLHRVATGDCYDLGGHGNGDPDRQPAHHHALPPGRLAERPSHFHSGA